MPQSLSEIPISEVKLSAIDFETTGLDPNKGDEICEVGIAIFRKDRLIDTYQSLVKISQPMPYEAYSVHNISDGDLIDAPGLSSVMEEVLDITDGSIFIAHNRDFDLSFFNASLIKTGYNEIKKPFLDLLEISRDLIKDIKNHKLATIAEELNLVKIELHRALGDALTTGRAFIAINDRFNLWEKPVSYFEKLSEHPRKDDINPLILNALSKHIRLRIIYELPDGKISDRIIRPINITEDNRMLISYCYLKEERRHFRLDRIVEVEELTQG